MRSVKWQEVDIATLALDVMLAASVIAVFVSDSKIIWFHTAFLVLVVHAFRLESAHLMIRAIPAGVGVVTGLIIARINGAIPQDELLELPILGAMIVAVSFAASRRRQALRELEDTKTTIDRLHRASQRELNDQLILGQRLQASNRLNVAVVHDINNALARIRIAADSIELHVSDRQLVVDTADEIAEHVAEAATIARELLSTARMTSALEVEPPEPITASLAAVTPLLRRLCPRGTVLHVDADALEARPTRLSRIRLEQILANLVANAVDALNGSGTIKIRAHTTTGPTGEEAVIEVIDDGPGIDDATLRRIFEPYFTTKGERGTGMGLYASRQLLETVGGSITAFSAPSSGTTIRITTPYAETATPARAGRLRALRVMVVDDDDELRNDVSQSLSHAGHVLRQATDGADALDLLRQDPDIDVIVTDFSMPRLDGLALIEEVERRHPAIGVVLITGEPDHPRLASTKTRVIAKPFEVAHLLAQLQLVAQEKRSKR